MKIMAITVFLFTCGTLFAQEKGFIRGQVFDGETGQTMIGAKVRVKGEAAGAMTDLDGKFSISIKPGTYDLLITFVAKDTMLVEEVEVKEGEATVLDNLTLAEEDNQLATVVVTVERRDNTENAVLNLKKQSVNMIDGISSANFKKIGDSDAAGAMKRVPGVSLAGGKYVYVRGLGDRYNKTVLNGMNIPGLDPDRNTLQMDLFPTSILDNIIVNKTFVAELPADFTGGIVDIGTKSFPDEQQRSISIGLGYNPYFHFRDDYLTYQGGKFDFLGFDDGTRTIPVEGMEDGEIPQYVDALGSQDDSARYVNILQGFNPTMSAMRKMSLMDISLSTSFGNQFKKKDVTIGYNFIGTYRNNTEFYDDATFGRYNLSPDSDADTFNLAENQVGSFGVNNVLLSGMAGLAFKTTKSKFVINLLHIQNGESQAGRFDYYNADQGSVFEGQQTNLMYTQRSMTNFLLGGKHDLYDKGWKVEWRLSPTLSIQNDPDIRFTRFEVREDSMIIGTEAGFPERIWRELQEISGASRLDIEKDFDAWKRKAKLKFGGAYTYKQRDYLIRNFQLIPREIHLEGDPDEILADENIWPYEQNEGAGTTYAVPFIPNNPNEFSSNVHNSAAYISTELSPAEKFKAIIGVRAEHYIQRYTGQDQLGANVLNNDVVLNNLGIFPSLNLVYQVNDKQNLRMSYGRTVARPSFKEISYAEIYDPITGRIFIGGLFEDAQTVGGETTVYWDGNLRSTDIHNFDLRWEMFHGRGQTVSISAFYKLFFDPIEIVQYTAQVGAFQPRNVGDGQVLGGELELRQSLEFFGAKMKNFSATFNLTYTYSRIELSPTEKQSRIDNAREGQVIGDYRDMAGQSPYVINGGLSYNGGEQGFLKGFEAGVYYNVQGRTLMFVGIAERPDIYSVPFHSLNFNLNKSFGESQKWRISLRVQNLLNDRKEAVFSAFGTEEQFFNSLAPGISSRLKVSYNF